MRSLLIESVDAELNEHIRMLVAFTVERLGIERVPVLSFKDSLGTNSFGLYHPAAESVTVATAGRHRADVLRTLAHELVHHRQMELESELDLLGLEYEANALAGMIMRDYNKAHPELYGTTNTGVPEGIEGEGVNDPIPTNPPYPTEIAETAVNSTGGLPTIGAPVEFVDDDPDWTDEEKIHAKDPLNPHAHTSPRNRGQNKEGKDRMKTLKQWRQQFNEDAAVNSAGSGAVEGIGVGPKGEPGIKKSPMSKTMAFYLRRSLPEPLRSKKKV